MFSQPRPNGTAKDGTMARIEDPLTRRFVREATLGLSVVVGLLVIIILSLAHRYGAWRKTPQADEIQVAKVYRRASAGDWNGAAEMLAAGETEVRPAKLAEPQMALQRQASEFRPAVVETPSGGGFRPRTETSPAGMQEPATGVVARFPSGPNSPLNPVVPEKGRSQKPDFSFSPKRPDIEGGQEAVPSPFRSVPANTASASSAMPAVQSFRSERDQVSPPDPNWSLRIDDTLFTYCERNYGDPQWFRAFHASLADQGLVFEKLGVGRVLRPPSRVELRQKYPDLVPEETSRGGLAPQTPLVEQGVYVTTGTESLFDLSARLMGQASRYVELVELNADRLPQGGDYLTPLPKGVQLRLPPR